MIHSPFIRLFLGAVLLVGFGAAYVVLRTCEDWGPVGHNPLVTRRAPLSVQATAFTGLLLCPIYILPALVAGFVFLATLHTLRRAGPLAFEVTGILSFLAGPLALLGMGVAAPIGLVGTSLALLTRGPDAAARARRVATIHICLGGILGALAAMTMVLSRTGDWFTGMHWATLCIAPALAAHALLLLHAASAVDAYEASRSQPGR